MISCRAPGKLFIAGEYAVVAPGHLAVLAAVDRYATATVTEAPGPGITLRTDLHGGLTLTCTRIGDRLSPATGDRDPGAAVPAAFSYVFAVASVLDRLCRERGIAVRPYFLDVTADLGDADGRKYGLGSSAAVTVAAVAALGRFHGLALTTMDRYRLAMLATIQVNPRASGGDVAASTWGGWLVYGSPDRGAVAAVVEAGGLEAALRAPWPGLAVRPLPAPDAIALHVGWTGEPASTPALVAGLGAKSAADHDRSVFRTESDACVGRLGAAIAADDAVAASAEIDRARVLLQTLDDAEGLGIMTPRLRALCAAGAAVGAAAKPSGAGGGDCGIALLDRTHTAAGTALTDHWVAAGIRPLPLRVHPAEGGIA
ncbi:phosphomevalonate kinase [Nocardia rhizosphaerae]|uniref:phosphomevalonate kinase n=1 Tax=Nocardia rhizosphaerae TaxID=1691571 RepID=A0ABV8LDX9_9NOCA